MCEKCIQKYQGMPLATAKNELLVALAKAHQLIELLAGGAPTPVDHVATEMDLFDALKPLGDLPQYIAAAEAGGRKFLSPATDGIVVRSSPLQEMFGLPPKVVTETWEATINARTPEGKQRLREKEGLPPLDLDSDGDDLPKFPLM